MKNQNLNQINNYNYDKIFIVKLDYFCERRYIERWFRKKKDGNMDGSYSHQKSGVAAVGTIK